LKMVDQTGVERDLMNAIRSHSPLDSVRAAVGAMGR
jgi:hypothetical protein